MSEMNNNSEKIIADSDEFQAFCESLEKVSRVSLDTEFMREKTYSPLLALIQVAGPDSEACIDPLAIDDLSAFGQLLANPAIEIVLHSCRQDFEAFDTVIDLNPTGLFDTQVAAAFCGYGDQVSYAAMVEQVCGVELAKSHTRADWTRRPLSEAEIEYALDDVRFLDRIRAHLEQKLDALGRLDWFRDECSEQSDPGNWRADPEQSWRRLKGAAGLPLDAHQTARRLAVWRERLAISRNRPREWILSTQTLLEIAREAPEHRAALAKLDGVHANILKHSSDELLSIVSETPRHRDAERLWVPQSMLEPTERKRVKGVMALLRDTAEKMSISPSLIANRSTVERYVRGERELGLFRGWRHDVAGAKILADGL